MARGSKKAGTRAAETPAGASAPDGAPPKGRKPTAPRSRKRTSTPAESVVVAEASKVVVADAPAPNLEQILRQTAEVWLQLKSLRADQEAAGRELSQHREESRAATRQFLQETRDGTDRVRRECEATTAQLGQVKRQFQDASRLLLAEFDSQLALVREELQTARGQLQAIPRQADEYRGRVEEMGRRLPEAEEQLQKIARTSDTTRLDLDRVERESRDARKRLDAVRQETAQEEVRLAAVRGEFREVEERLRELRRQLDRMTGEAATTRDRIDEQTSEEAEAAVKPPEVPNQFGVTVDPGVVVADVLPGTPAEVAGLARGDVVTAVNGTPVFTGPELRDRVQDAAEGEEIALRVNRGGVPRDVTVRLDPAAHDEGTEEGRNQMGLTVQPGVVVAEVVPGTPAEVAGLAPGDVIAEVNGTPIPTGEQLREAVLGASGHEVMLRVRRGGEDREVAVRLDVHPVRR